MALLQLQLQLQLQQSHASNDLAGLAGKNHILSLRLDLAITCMKNPERHTPERSG